MYKLRFRQLFKPLLIAALIVFTYVLIYVKIIPFLSLPSLLMQDFFCQLKYKLKAKPAAAKEIVLVAIDDKTYYEYGKKWPWTRDLFAGLVANINRGKPAVIGMNIGFFKESDEQAYDLVLKESFRDAGNVVLASFSGAQDDYIIPDGNFLEVIKDYGFTNKPGEEDEVIRYTSMFEPLTKREHPDLLIAENILDYCFELKLLCAYYGIPSENLTWTKGRVVIPREQELLLSVPVDERGYTFLNYTVKLSDLTIVPVLDVLNNKIPPGLFKDKIVIVGATAEVLKERNNTPLGALAGVEVIANTLIMLLAEDYILVDPFYLNFILFIIFITIGVYCFWRFPAVKNIMIMFGLIAAYLGLSVILLWQDIVVDFFSIPLFILISFIAIEAIKYSSLIIEGIRLRNMVITDDVTGLSTRRYFVFKLGSELKRAIAEKKNLSVVLLTIDNFNLLNASLGAEKSDYLLKGTGAIIRRNSRASRGVDFIARYGEHSYGVILIECGDDGAVSYLRRLKIILEKPVVLPAGGECKVSLSGGVVALNLVKTEKPLLFIEHAQKALGRAETEGPGRIIIYDRERDKIDLDQVEVPQLEEVGLNFVAEELKERNAALRNMIAKLRSAYKEIANAEKFSAMGKLASSIHHELNNPLAALRTCLQRITKDLESPDAGAKLQKQKSMVGAALEEVNRMITMNKELKQLYKPARASLEKVDVNKVLSDMFLFLRNEISKHKIKLTKELAEDLPPLAANRADLRQSFLNIVLNAIDVMPDGGELKITTSFDKANKTVLIKISDTGCGIPAENLDKVFEPMFTTKGETKGSGLGLYVTKQKVELHQGTIKVESRVNAGTTFIIFFPVNH